MISVLLDTIKNRFYNFKHLKCWDEGSLVIILVFNIFKFHIAYL